MPVIVDHSTTLGYALSKGVKPPPFDGSKVNDWIFKINQYLQIIAVNATEREKILFSANMLTGKALTWWRHKITIENP